MDSVHCMMSLKVANLKMCACILMLFRRQEKRVGSVSKDSYVKSLLDQGKVKINEKVLEEALELLEATNDVSVDKNKKIIHETADLWFHTMVLLLNEGIHIDDVLDELNNRLGISGHKEKSSRKKNKEK